MNRIIVITGTSSGIGERLVQLFKHDNDTVCCLSRTNPNNQDNFYICDVTNEQNVIQVFNEIGEKYGRIDILINNAGAGISGACELLDSARVKENIDINFMGAFYCSRQALSYMSRGAKIINISSVCAFFAMPYREIYCASKAALNMLSYGLRMELSSSGIQVCAICPGDIKTSFSKNRVKNYATNARYGDRVARSVNSVDAHEDKRMSVEYAAKKAYSIINRKRLKPAVIIGNKYKVFYFLYQLFPLNMFLRVIDKMFGGY